MWALSSCGVCVCAKSLQSCPALCDPMNCSPQAPLSMGILRARILEWLLPSSRGSSPPRHPTLTSYVCYTGRRVLYHQSDLKPQLWRAGAYSLVAVVSHCGGLSCCRARALGHELQGTNFSAGAHGLPCSATCRIFPDQGLTPYPLHWQVESQPLDQQGSPDLFYFRYCSANKHHFLSFLPPNTLFSSPAHSEMNQPISKNNNGNFYNIIGQTQIEELTVMNSDNPRISMVSLCCERLKK